ncbi:MAG: hypothetical protein ACJAQZ_002215 [Planctomycetota bacterium]|jgi:hypothetical protein
MAAVAGARENLPLHFGPTSSLAIYRVTVRSAALLRNNL